MPHAANRQPQKAHTTVPGTGELHHALEEARDLSRLHAFCESVGCDEATVSKDGKRLDMLMVFALMRTRGYVIGDPVRPQTQLKKGFTTWITHVVLPCGISFDLAVYTPDESYLPHPRRTSTSPNSKKGNSHVQ